MKPKPNDHQSAVAAAQDALAVTERAVAQTATEMTRLIKVIGEPRRLVAFREGMVEDEGDILNEYLEGRIADVYDGAMDVIQQIDRDLVAARLRAEVAGRCLERIEARRRALEVERATKTNALMAALAGALIAEAALNRSKNRTEFEAAAELLKDAAGLGADPEPTACARLAPGEIQQAPVEAQVAA